MCEDCSPPRPATVREAFALAGYPVPEGAKLDCWCPSHGRNIWMYYDGKQHVDFEKGGWVPQGGLICGLRSVGMNLSNLPVADALSALPQVVKDALKGGGDA